MTYSNLNTRLQLPMSTKQMLHSISIRQFAKLIAKIEDYNKRDEEAIARAKVEREKWLEEKKKGTLIKDQD